MTGAVTVYFNTGFNGVDIPSSQQVLLSAQKKTYNDVYFMREDIDKPTIRIKDTYENLCAVDYCQITITTGNVSKNSFYFASPSALTKGVTLLALDLDALLTMGGAENLTYISGWQERGHIKKTDDTLFGNIAAEDWCPSQPLEVHDPQGLDIQTGATKDCDVIISNIALHTLGVTDLTQDVIQGIVSGATDPSMYLPLIPVVDPTNETPFAVWDYTDGQGAGAYRSFHLPNTAGYDPSNTTVRQALQKLFSCGQLQLQNSYKIPKRYLQEDPTPGVGVNAGRYGTIKGLHGDVDIANLPFEYTIGTGQSAYTPKNKKVFSTFRNYVIVNNGSGDMCSKEASEIYDGTATYPTVNLWADPCSTGKPFARFKYIKNNPIQYSDCVRGLQWANTQLVMEGASGSLWNSIDNAFANQQLQRQQSMNLFESGIAAQNYGLQKEMMESNLKYDKWNWGMSQAEGIVGQIAGITKSALAMDPSGIIAGGAEALSAGFNRAKANLSLAQAIDNNTLQTKQLWNNMQADSSRAEMANNSIQNQINQNNIGLLRSNRVIAPTVSFTPEQNLGLYGYNDFVIYEIRKTDDDLKSEDMYYQRYGYNGLHRPLTQQAFKERTYYNYVQAFDINLKAPSAEFGLRVRTKAIAQLNKGVRVWRVLPDPQYYETN